MASSESGSDGEHLTPRQQRWFATVKANLEAQTGRPISEWVAIARGCPHAAPRARTQWLKDNHSVGVNHAAFILSVAFPQSTGWDNPEALRAALWKDPGSDAIHAAIEAAARSLSGLVVGQRKSFTALSREVQFAAMRPLKGGRARLGLKLDPTFSQRLSPATRRESWSERLVAVLEFDNVIQVDDEVRRLIAAAYENG